MVGFTVLKSMVWGFGGDSARESTHRAKHESLGLNPRMYGTAGCDDVSVYNPSPLWEGGGGEQEGGETRKPPKVHRPASLTYLVERPQRVPV